MTTCFFIRWVYSAKLRVITCWYTNSASKQKYIPAVYMARMYAGLGKKDKAFERLEKAYNQRSFAFGPPKGSPSYDPLRTDPRFTDLLRRMNLQP